MRITVCAVDLVIKHNNNNNNNNNNNIIMLRFARFPRLNTKIKMLRTELYT